MRYLTIMMASALLLLTGCAATVRSDVTTFHQWSAATAQQNYAFEPPTGTDDTLEYRSYQDLVRADLAALGFTDVGPGAAPTLLVSLRFSAIDAPVKVIEVIEPLTYSSPRYGYWRPFRRSPFGRLGLFYDPFWYGMPDVHETLQHHYRRELQVSIKTTAGVRLFDVTVRNISRESSTPAIMPALVHSAFVGFPGPNGATRTVEFKHQ